MLFHYDGRTTEWDEFEWSKRAIHVSVMKQTKWYVIANINLNCFCMAFLNGIFDYPSQWNFNNKILMIHLSCLFKVVCKEIFASRCCCQI